MGVWQCGRVDICMAFAVYLARGDVYALSNNKHSMNRALGKLHYVEYVPTATARSQRTSSDSCHACVLLKLQITPSPSPADFLKESFAVKFSKRKSYIKAKTKAVAQTLATAIFAFDSAVPTTIGSTIECLRVLRSSMLSQLTQITARRPWTRTQFGVYC